MSEKRSSWERNCIFLRHIEQCIYTHTHTEQLCLLSWEQMHGGRQFFLNVASIVCRCSFVILSSCTQKQDAAAARAFATVASRRCIMQMRPKDLGGNGKLMSIGNAGLPYHERYHTRSNDRLAFTLYRSLSACTNKHTCTQTHTQLAIPVKLQSASFPFWLLWQ